MMRETSLIPRLFLTHFYVGIAIVLCITSAIKWWLAAIIIVAAIFLQLMPVFTMLMQLGLAIIGCMTACMVVMCIRNGDMGHWYIAYDIIEFVLYVIYCFFFATFAPFPQLMELLKVDSEWYDIPKSHYWPGGW